MPSRVRAFEHRDPLIGEAGLALHSERHMSEFEPGVQDLASRLQASRRAGPAARGDVEAGSLESRRLVDHGRPELNAGLLSQASRLQHAQYST